jgi:hypothetical protein
VVQVVHSTENLGRDLRLFCRNCGGYWPAFYVVRRFPLRGAREGPDRPLVRSGPQCHQLQGADDGHQLT